MENKGSTFEEAHPEVREAMEELGKDVGRFDEVEVEAIRCINTVADMAETLLISLNEMPGDRAKEKCSIGVSTIIERCHQFQNWRNRL